MQKISPENFLLLLKNCQKTEMISLSYEYDVNGHAYSKSKSIHFRMDLANIEVKQILTLK